MKIIKDAFNIKLIRFFIVAGINTIFGYGIFALLIYIGLHYTLAGFISTILGILFNFKTYGLIVFKNKNNKLLLRFLFVYIVNYCVAIIFIWIMSKFKVSEYISLAVIAIPNATLGFFLNKKFVFEANNKINEI